MKKRSLGILLVLCMVLSLMPVFSVPAEAAAGLTLQELKAKFPAGRYWNGNNPDGTTNRACTVRNDDSHSHPDVGDADQGSSPGDNYWCGACQCYGFALKVAYDACGITKQEFPENVGFKKVAGDSALDILKPGDIIRVGGEEAGHSVFVTEVNGDSFLYGDCNFSGPCQIRWDVQGSKQAVKNGSFHGYVFSYILSAPQELVTDGTPPEIIDNVVRASGLVCFSDGKEGFQLTATVRDNNKIDKVYANIWQFGQTEANAIRVNAEAFTSAANTDIPITINFKPVEHGMNEHEGIFFWKVYVSDGSNLVENVVDPQKNECDSINLFAVIPDDDSSGSYKLKSDAPIRQAPYEKWNGADTKVGTKKSGDVVSCIGKYVNSYDHDWYQMEDGNWIYGSHLKKYTSWLALKDKIKSFVNQTIYFINGQPVRLIDGAVALSVDDSSDSTQAAFIVKPIVHASGSSSSTNYTTVYFDANGGSCTRTRVSYVAGAAYGWFPTPSRFGYTFDGWFTEPEGGRLVSADETCASGTTLYAHWTRIILLQGSCGDNMTFVLYGDGELDITGSGQMTSHPWTDDYAKNVFYVKMEGEITSICSDAFKGCTYLYQADLAPHLVSIGSQAFSGCTDLQTIDFPSTLTSIGTVAFRNCTSLRGITLPANLTELGAWAFRDCDSITQVNIPKGITSIPSYLPNETSFLVDWRRGEVFYGCDSLKTVTFDEGISEIPGILNHCPSIEEIVIPDTVTTIATRAFRDCTALKKVVIPSSVTTIGPIAFMGCRALSEVQLPPNLKSLGAWAFYNCDSIREICIPARITEFPKHVFQESYDYNSYPLEVYNEVFRACDNLKKVTFANGITTIPTVLNRCTSLETIEIPNTVVTISNSAFENCTSLQSLSLPASVREIGSKAFYNCSSMKKAVLNEGLETLNSKAFASCSALETINLPDSLKSIQSGIFIDCTSLKSAKIPDIMSGIPSNMFENCSSLTEYTLPKRASFVGSSAFKSCTSLKTVVWNDTLQEIHKNAFEGCSSLQEVKLPGNVTSVGESAFSNCDGLTLVVLPDSVSTCGVKAFYDCDALKNVTLSNSMTTISNSTFEHCDVLEALTIPYSVTSIGSNVFKDCVKFTSLTIPRATTSIQTNAVSYPDILTIYGVKGTIAETYANTIGAAFVAIDHPIQAISLDKKEVSLLKNNTLRLIPTFTPIDFTDEVSWKSSDTSVATVDSTGLVKGVAGGTATISVVAGNIKATCTVTVLQPVTSISLNKTSLSLNAGSTYTLTATVNPSNANNKAIRWTSSDASVATVTQDGVVTALKKGTATITCAAQDGSGVSRSCTVTVPNNVITVTDVKDLQSAHPYEVNCSDVWIYQNAGAGSLKVTFSQNTSLEAGSDYIYLYDSDGNQIGRYTGTELAGQTVTVPGYMVKIKLVSDSSYCEYGFAVTNVETIPLDHTHAIMAVAKVDATCTADGTEAYWKCSVCGMMFSDAQGKNVIKAPAVIKATGHKWDAGKVTTQPTETTEGVKTFTCTVCGQTRTESIPKLNPQPTTPPTPTTPPVTSFSDVPADAYFAEPVSWAVNHVPQITNGTGDGKFSPKDECQRCQIVTFLWRAMGCPEPTSTNNPFVDVKPGDYFYKPVLWAVEKGITNGMDLTHFDPTSTCTRGQAVTFLWRAEGRPAPRTQASEFTDVQNPNDYFYTPVLWAVENGITNGTGNGMFSPNMICLREQIVTFLYRDLA